MALKQIVAPERLLALLSIFLMGVAMASDSHSLNSEEDAFGRWLEETGQSHLLENSGEEAMEAAFMRLFVEWTKTLKGEQELDRHLEQIAERYGMGLVVDPAPPLQVLDGVDADEVAIVRSLYEDEDDKAGMAVTDKQGRITELGIYTYISGTNASINGALRRLSRLQHVRKASIGCDLGSPETRKPLPEDTLMPLAGWGQLESLEIDLENMGAQALLNLAAKNPLKQLRAIDIRVHVQANVAMRALLQTTELRQLEMQDNDLSDDGLRCLKNASKLEELTLIYTQVTGIGFDQLTCLETLKKATLEDSPISDLGLQQLSRFNQLEELYLGQSKVTDVGVKYLGKLSHLRDLSLSGTAITADGLEVLLDLKRLEALWIEDTQLGDEVLPTLEKVKGLKTLWAKQGTKITPAGISRLQKALPDCDIVR